MKEYKRLTKKDWHEAKFDCLDQNKKRAILKRLWELENDIESGKVIRLPCKVGDTVYEINTILREYCEHEVGGFSIENGELIIIDCIDNRYKESELCFSKAESENKLKELKNENTRKQ